MISRYVLSATPEINFWSRRPSGLRKTKHSTNSLAHRTTWLRSDFSWYSGAELIIIIFIYGTITPYGPTFQLCSINHDFSLCSVRNPRNKFLVWALSFSLAATKKIDFSFSSSRYLDVSVPWVYLHKAMYSLYDTWGFPCEFPHSEIFGSLTMCVYPKLIAAYRVLHRLLMPRHSPYALCSLTILAHLTSALLLL